MPKSKQVALMVRTDAGLIPLEKFALLRIVLAACNTLCIHTHTSAACGLRVSCQLGYGADSLLQPWGHEGSGSRFLGKPLLTNDSESSLTFTGLPAKRARSGAIVCSLHSGYFSTSLGDPCIGSFVHSSALEQPVQFCSAEKASD